MKDIYIEISKICFVVIKDSMCIHITRDDKHQIDNFCPTSYMDIIYAEDIAFMSRNELIENCEFKSSP